MTKPSERNPQAEQMADESMIRNLAAQANAIWPQEALLFDRYQLRPDARIADIGCGTGEITSRLAAKFPRAQLVGVDILESSVAFARDRHAGLGSRVQFVQGDAFELQLPANHFDLVVCRHMTQCVPEPEKVLAELKRICRPGGWVHVLSEDYGMFHVTPGEVDPDEFWHVGVSTFARNTGLDQRVGRRTWSLLRKLGFENLAVDYVTVDTQRVPRPTFAAILEAWRDGYTDAIVQHTTLTRDEVRGYFEYMIRSIRDPASYVVWQVPVLGGKKIA